MKFMSQPCLLRHEGLLQGQIKFSLKGHHSHCLWVGRMRRFCTPSSCPLAECILCGKEDRNQRFQQCLTPNTQLLLLDSPVRHRSSPKGRENNQEGHSAEVPSPENPNAGQWFSTWSPEGLAETQITGSPPESEEVWGFAWEPAFLPSP